MSADSEIRELFKSNNVAIYQDDVWKVQSATVVKHKALERLAAAIRIQFAEPKILRAERDEAVLLVTGQLPSGVTEWSVGEALIVQEGQPGGNYKVTGRQASYVWAMAEKRAKDRVILKLAGLHGVYSEEEADDFKAPRGGNSDPQLDELTDGRPPAAKVLNPATGRLVDPNSSSQQKKPGGLWDTLISSLRKCEDPGELCTWYLGNQAEIGALNATMKKALAEEWQKGIRDDLAKCLGKDDVFAWKALWERDIASLAPYAQMLVTQEYEDRLAFFGIMREAAE
jgi:hypothetical protein